MVLIVYTPPVIGPTHGHQIARLPQHPSRQLSAGRAAANAEIRNHFRPESRLIKTQNGASSISVGGVHAIFQRGGIRRRLASIETRLALRLALPD